MMSPSAWRNDIISSFSCSEGPFVVLYGVVCPSVVCAKVVALCVVGSLEIVVCGDLVVTCAVMAPSVVVTSPV